MRLVVRKPAFCICENKDADQLRGNREADQRLCFRYTGSTTPLLPKYEISSLQPSFVAVQTGLCQTWSERRPVFSERGSYYPITVKSSDTAYVKIIFSKTHAQRDIGTHSQSVVDI